MQLDIFGDNDDSVDIFGSAEVNLATTNGGQDAPSVSDAATSNGFSEGSGYVYDETSGWVKKQIIHFQEPLSDHT